MGWFDEQIRQRMRRDQEVFEESFVRVAGSVNHNVTSTDKDVNARNGMMNTVIGLLAKGDLNCAGQTITKTDLFGDQSAATAPTPEVNKPAFRKPGETEPVVMTAKEKEALEEDRRRKQAEAQRAAELNAKDDEEPRGKGFLGRLKDTVKDFTTKLISEESDEDNK